MHRGSRAVSLSWSLFFLCQSHCPITFLFACFNDGSAWLFLRLSADASRGLGGCWNNDGVYLVVFPHFSNPDHPYFMIHSSRVIRHSEFPVKRNILKRNKVELESKSKSHCFTGKVSQGGPVKPALESEEHPVITCCKSYFSGSKVPKHLKKAIPWVTKVLLLFKPQASGTTQ